MHKEDDVQEGLSKCVCIPHSNLIREEGPVRNLAPHPTTTHVEVTRFTLTEVILKALEGISYERERHLGRFLLLGRRSGLESAVDLHGVGGLLLQILGGEISGIDLGRQARLEGGAEAAEVVEVDARKEGVAFQFAGPDAAKAVLAVADEAIWCVRWVRTTSGNWVSFVVTCFNCGAEGQVGRDYGIYVVGICVVLVRVCVRVRVCVCVCTYGRRTFGLGARRSGQHERHPGNRDNAAS